jgi:undecaprenyl-diphosphatase
MTLLQALILGTLQGLTEFLPVSSTAHLYLAQELLGIENDARALSFDVVLHLGTLLALVLVTWRELARIAAELLRWAGRRPPRDPAARGLLLPLAIGTVPGALAGLFLLHRVEELRTIGLIGISMLIACGFFLVAERRAERSGRERTLAAVDGSDGFWVGLAQAAAGLMAGFSRSGFTISTGRLRNLDREDAARFSFLIAVPIIAGAGAKSVLDLARGRGAPLGAAVIAGGFAAAAIVGFFAARFLLRFLRTHSLRPFAVYLGLLGAALIAWHLSHRRPLLAPRPASETVSAANREHRTRVTGLAPSTRKLLKSKGLRRQTAWRPACSFRGHGPQAHAGAGNGGRG